MKKYTYFLLLLSLFSLGACTKVEGEGGAATISGTLNGQKFNGAGALIAEYPLLDHDVYIIYGSSSTYFDDRIRTSYDGTFEFRNLQPGSYTVFMYQDDSSEPSGKSTITLQATIDKKDKKSTINLGTINVKD